MGMADATTVAPQVDTQPNEPSRRRSSDANVWTNRNWMSVLNSSMAPSRSSVAEVGSAAPVREPGDRQGRAGPNVSLVSASNRSLLGGIKRRLSNSSLGRQSRVATELWKELELVKRNILSSKPWVDGVFVMWIVISNTATSVLVAWLVAFVYAVGSPLAPFRPMSSSQLERVVRGKSLHFASALGGYFVGLACLSHAVVMCYILADRLLTVHRKLRHSFVRIFLTYVCIVLPAMVLTTGLGSGLFVLLDQMQPGYNNMGRIHALLLLIVVSVYIDYTAMHKARPIRRRILERLCLGQHRIAPSTQVTRSTPPLELLRAALDSSVAAVPASGLSPFRRLSTITILPRAYPKTFFEKFIRGYRGFILACFGAMFGYLHLSLTLRFTHQWHLSLFAAFSLSLKIAIQEATKQLFLSPPRKPSARTTHMLMTLPTVMIDAQIRMVFVQIGLARSTSSSSTVFTSSFIIVVCKIFFRLAKILRLRHTIKSRLGHSKGMQRILKRVNSRIAVRDVAMARAEYSQFLDWRNHRLRLHAAEVYADMHAEYISIGVAIVVVFVFANHPMYALRSNEAQRTQQMVSALVQLGIGLVFDYIASVVEGVYEVPLYEAIGDEGRRLRVFMHVLLGAITAVNVGVVAAFLLARPNE